MPTTDSSSDAGTDPSSAAGSQPTAEPGPAPDPGIPDALLSEYIPFDAVELSDAERWPSLTPADLQRVLAARAHPHAPAWRHETGDRLTAADHEILAQRAEDGECTAQSDGQPAWIGDLIERVHGTVPRYRRASRQGQSTARSPLSTLPLVSRADLMADMASHVDLTIPLDRVLEGSSSGSSGAALTVPLHPVTLASDLMLIRALVQETGATWEADPTRFGLALVTDQRAVFTYVSALTALPRPSGQDVSLMARINLDEDAWRAPGDREAWLAEHDPQVISSATLPLLRLLELADAGLELHPIAVVNGATHVTAGVRQAVSDTWDVPVIDLYGLRETGPIAVAHTADAERNAHVILASRRVHVETLDADGEPVSAGERGEVVVTVDENPYLPLLRYRTGDFAALREGPRGPELVGLEGREPVAFRDVSGRLRPSVDAAQVLQACGLLAWHLDQNEAGDVLLRGLAAGDSAARRDAVNQAGDAISRWLELPVRTEVLSEAAELGEGKPRRFTSSGP